MLEASENPRVVMQQVGHTDPALTLRIYAQVMKRRERAAEARVDALLVAPQRAAGGRGTSIATVAETGEMGRTGQRRRRARLSDPADLLPSQPESR